MAEDLTWPASNIVEVSQLINNAKEMSHTLSGQFREIAQINTELESRVEERTVELSETNQSLRREIDDRIKAELERDRLMKEIQAKNKELESIIYVSSHDLRSPLVNIQGFSRKLAKSCASLTKTLSELELPPEKREDLLLLLTENMPRSIEFITGSVEKMDCLLSGLLRLSRLGRAAITIENLDMNLVMSKITNSLAYQVESSGAKISVDWLLPCLGDSVQINQVFTNLLDNAIKYRSAERPLTVHVSSQACPDGVQYCVEDNGIGIHPDYHNQVWEIFHRVNPRDIPGEGLGLTASRRILDRLNGTIWLESEEGAGSRFYVKLPALRI
jgi:signal transduction histidine kinase